MKYPPAEHTSFFAAKNWISSKCQSTKILNLCNCVLETFLSLSYRCLIVIITKSKLTILNQLHKYVQWGYEEWENMLLVQYSWSIAAFAKQVALILIIFHVQKSHQLSKRNACLVLGPPLSPLSSWSSCWRGWSNLCLTPLTPFTLKRKKTF